MLSNWRSLLGGGLRFSARICNGLARRVEGRGSSMITASGDRSLYRTPDGDYFWLNDTSYVDQCIIRDGVFEADSVRIVRELVKPGQVVLDVGANIGYYTVILAKLVGPEGRVFAFEPTQHFQTVLKRNVAANDLLNVEIVPSGLSSKPGKGQIEIGESTATLHVPGGARLAASESISLTSLDAFANDQNLDRLDFIKVDIDGHEPAFLEGAHDALSRFDPPILLEISHQHYLEAGVTAWDFFARLRREGYRIYDEADLSEFTSLVGFLSKCGNFAYSRNILISRKAIRNRGETLIAQE